MKSWVGAIRNEKGVALPLALFALVMLTGLLLAFLSMAGMEPTIAANLNDVTRARYVADAGIEFAFDQLAGNSNWNSLLLGPDAKANTADDGQLASNVTLPGLPAANGTFSVTMRNDTQAGDTAITGQAALDAGGAMNDTNGIVIVTATGTYRGVSRQIQVVARRIQIPQMPGALNCAGLQCDFDMGVVSDWTNHHFHSVGLDYAQDPGNPAAMVGVSGNMKYAIAVPTGNQYNTGQSFESRVENALNKHQINETDGLAQGSNPPQAVVSRQYNGAGKNAIAGDAQLVSKVDGNGNFLSNPVSDFVNLVKAQPGVIVMQSQTGAGGVTIQNGKPLGANSSLPVNLGTTKSPTITYFKGDPNNASNPDRILSLRGTNSGAGILIVQDGTLQIYDSFRWDGVIILTGKNVAVTFDKNNQADVYGGILLNETQRDLDTPNYELQLQKNCVHSEDGAACGGNDTPYTKMYSSSQRVTQAQNIRSLVKASGWREK